MKLRFHCGQGDINWNLKAESVVITIVDHSGVSGSKAGHSTSHKEASALRKEDWQEQGSRETMTKI